VLVPHPPFEGRDVFRLLLVVSVKRRFPGQYLKPDACNL
jgi:hypothetical protein